MRDNTPSKLETLFAPGQYVDRLDDEDFAELCEIIEEERLRREQHNEELRELGVQRG